MRLAWALAVVAVVCVLGSSAVALADRLAGRHAPAPGASGVWLEGPDVRVRLPAGWRLTGPDEAVQYADGAGRVLASVASPAVLDPGFCAEAASSSRAFVGWLPVGGAHTRSLSRRTAERWVSAVALDPRTGRAGRARAVSSQRVEGGHRSDAVVDVPPGPCAPPRAHVTVLSVATPAAAGGGAATLVMVRDVDAPGVLDDEVAERILASLEPR